VIFMDASAGGQGCLSNGPRGMGGLGPLTIPSHPDPRRHSGAIVSRSLGTSAGGARTGMVEQAFRATACGVGNRNSRDLVKTPEKLRSVIGNFQV
jgi:hypothetical protein